MKTRVIYGDSLPEAYHLALTALKNTGEQVDCKDWNTTALELDMTVVVRDPLREPRISRLFPGGPADLEQYRQEMLDGILDFEIGLGNWAYTYHNRMASQIDAVVSLLRENPSSRRAVIIIRRLADLQLEDPPCLQHIQYFIRDGKLDCCVLFRSNDAVKAFYMNAFALICLQERIAKELGVEVGTYTHKANSFHCYAKDFDTLKGYCKRIKSGDTTYYYEGDWDEQMTDAQPAIAEKVRFLRDVK